MIFKGIYNNSKKQLIKWCLWHIIIVTKVIGFGIMDLLRAITINVRVLRYF